MFVGGTGTKTGEPTFGTTWGNSTTLSPPLPVLNAISQSPLHKKILLLQRYQSAGGYPALAGGTSLTRTGSTQGSFKILALQRTPTAAPRPTGKTNLLINLNASASGYALSNNGTTYYPPNIPAGMTYSHTLKAWSGTDSSTSTSPSVSKNQLATIDWDNATLVNGETDIYEVEISTGTVGAEASAQFSNCYGYPLVSAWATPSVDDRSVVLTRGVGNKEKTVYEGGVPVTYGDTTYSYKEHRPLNLPMPKVNLQTVNVGFNGNWSVNTLDIPLFRKNVTWTWAVSGDGLESGLGTAENYDDAKKTTVDGNLHLWKNVFGYDEQWTSGTTAPDSTPILKAPQTAVLKYFARDNVDNAEAEARYVLTLHEPIEIVSHRQVVIKYNIEVPAYVPDGNGVWNLLTTLQTNAGQTILKGTQTVGVSRTSARAKGFSYGFDGGIQLAFAATLGYTHNEEASWSKEISVSAELERDISNGESAYIVVLFPFQRLKSTYRLYESSGEIRRTGSPAYPAPSNPYALVFDESTAVVPTIMWRIVAANIALPGPKTSEPVFSAPNITES